MLVGDIAEQVRGVTYAKSEARTAPSDGFVPILRANNISDDGISFESLVYVPEARIAAKQRLKAGDVIVAASSGSLSVVGKAAPLMTEFGGSFGAFCKALRPNKQIVDPAYFAHFFRTSRYRRIISSLASGANINNLKNEHLDNLEIPVPTLDEQRRIAAILDKADALRRKRKRALELLDSLTQSVFVEIFGDPIENNRGHPTKKLSSLVDEVRGISYGIVQRGEDLDDGVSVIRISDFQSGNLDTSNLKKTSVDISKRYKRTALRGGELVISIRGTVGRCAEIPDSISGANVSREVAVIPTISREKNNFYLTLLRSRSAQRRIAGDIKGVAQSGINLEDLRALEIIQPNNDDMKRFDATMFLFAEIKANQKSASLLAENQFEALQHRAFSSQL